jgi:hypothetical protein
MAGTMTLLKVLSVRPVERCGHEQQAQMAMEAHRRCLCSE